MKKTFIIKIKMLYSEINEKFINQCIYYTSNKFLKSVKHHDYTAGRQIFAFVQVEKTLISHFNVIVRRMSM